jgi:hypothetical protein
VNIGMFSIGMSLLSIISTIYPKVEFPDHKVILTGIFLAVIRWSII